jgi:23S rRNA (pseudouridine1915-N3)-methyltransferase
MRITLCAVGRAKAGPERTLFDHYKSRLSFPFDLKEVEERKRLSGAQLKQREAELLLAQVPDGAIIVALDERGKNLSSPDLATRFGNWRDDGRRDIAFIIGGADGLDDKVRNRADLVVSLGKLTWPHMLVRGLITEQIYRAQCILSGHPYHRD